MTDLTVSSTQRLHTCFFQCLRTTVPAEAITYLQQCSPAEWQQLLTLANEQRVEPLFYHRLLPYQAQLNMPEDVFKSVQLSFYHNVMRNTRIAQELSKLLRLFQQHNIQVIVLKGACLANTVYTYAGLRVMMDLDLLLPVDRINQAVALLLADGYQPQGPLGQVITDHFAVLHHLPPFRHPDSTITIEVHTAVAPPDRFYSVDSQELWAQARPLSIGTETALSLDVEDLLLYTCMHATYRHLLELDARFLCDLDAIIHTYQQVIDWKLVERRARARQWLNGVYLSLELAHTLLATPVPPLVLRTLQPATFTRQRREEALALLLGNQPEAAIITGEFAQQWRTLPWHTKLKKGIRMSFLPRRILATYYPVAPDSLQILLYYPIRIYDLLRQNLPRMRLLWRADAADRIQQKGNVMEWLEKG